MLYVDIDEGSKSLKYKNIDLIDGHISYEPDSFIPYNTRDLSERENENIDTICRDHNSIELERAKHRFEQVKQTLDKIPSSQEYINQKEYYENVIGEYLSWFEQNGIEYNGIQGIREKDFILSSKWAEVDKRKSFPRFYAFQRFPVIPSDRIQEILSNRMVFAISAPQQVS